MTRAIHAFIKDERGLTSIECAAILAVLIPLTFAFAEIHRYNRYARHIDAAAHGVATLIGARAAALSGAALTQDSAPIADIFAEGAAPLGARWREGVGVQATLVRLVAAPAASIVWTWSGGADSSRLLLTKAGVLRACGPLDLEHGAQGNGTELAEGAADLRILVDLVYPFRPMLVSDVLGPRLMVWRRVVPVVADLTDVSGLSDEVTRCS